MVSGQVLLYTTYEGVKRRIAKLMLKCGLVGQVEKHKSIGGKVGTLVRFLATRKEGRQFHRLLVKLAKERGDFGIHYTIDSNLAYYNSEVVVNMSPRKHFFHQTK